jgi:hypothetical protein
VEPNKCDNLECTAQPDGTGICTTGPDQPYCDGLVRANGEPMVPCNPANTGDQSECAALNAGADLGTCAVTRRLLCLPETTIATGTPNPTAPIGASTFCVPPTDSGAINSGAGLPGPGRVVNQAKARTFCGPVKPNVFDMKVYQPGVGCPP